MSQLAAFTTNNLTAQAIVKAADREAGNAGLYLTDAGTETLAAPAYVKLQAILDHEALSGDWPFRMDATTLTIPANTRTVGLPSDYWQAPFTECWWIHPDTGHRTQIRLQDRRGFHDHLMPTGDGKAPPLEAMIAKNQGAADGGTPSGVVMVNPVWDRSYLLELHYSPLAIPLAAITTKPWLPFSLYLIKRLVAELFSDQDDQRMLVATAQADKLKRDLKLASSDPGQRARSIPVSADVFAPPVRI